MKSLNSEILREVGTLARLIQTVSDGRFREFGLQRGQFVFVTRICEQPGINLMELAQRLRVDKTTAAKAVQKLVESGLVRRERDNGDHRVWHLFPTGPAEALYPRIIDEENRNIGVCFDGLSPAEQADACRLLRRLRENVDRDWREPGRPASEPE